ncbi:hypothetical protein [Deinococcus daejeonensis]|uniref:Uncharacterized protein n=1 Tax=Deinococcus daejeonensis TaxID=1007098 RepID=A0ABQ2JDN8_9DEIO|nr:hypothetical protein [Deinococcus daejeonensis]GGN45439.1 hypothetical protein GCM10010842_34950 [Deinococcus daejeonensis]
MTLFLLVLLGSAVLSQNGLIVLAEDHDCLHDRLPYALPGLVKPSQVDVDGLPLSSWMTERLSTRASFFLPIPFGTGVRLVQTPKDQDAA